MGRCTSLTIKRHVTTLADTTLKSTNRSAATTRENTRTSVADGASAAQSGRHARQRRRRTRHRHWREDSSSTAPVVDEPQPQPLQLVRRADSWMQRRHFANDPAAMRILIRCQRGTLASVAEWVVLYVEDPEIGFVLDELETQGLLTQRGDGGYALTARARTLMTSRLLATGKRGDTAKPTVRHTSWEV